MATAVERETRENEISATVSKERKRLFSFISSRTPTIEDAEDILQDVFYELVQADTIEHTAAWLYRVARNKITDFFRKMKPDRLDDIRTATGDEEDALFLSDIIPSIETSPEKQLLLKLVSAELSDTLDELPSKQREVFVMHEIEGRSMKEIADFQNTNVKTVISRKRYAVIYLQHRLRDLYEELTNE